MAAQKKKEDTRSMAKQMADTKLTGSSGGARLSLTGMATGSAHLKLDDKGKQIIEYPQGSGHNIFDPSSGDSRIAAPKTEDGIKTEMESVFELVKLFKSGKPAADVLKAGKATGGVIFDMTKILITDFKENEIRCWMDLSDSSFAPGLYSFYLKDKRIHIHMEMLKEAKTLRNIMDEGIGQIYEKQGGGKLVKPFSLFVLHGALEAFSFMHDKNWNHKDVHGGNVMVQKQPEVELTVKIIDFGSADLYDSPVKGIDSEGFRGDIIGTTRIFTGMYVSYEGNYRGTFQKDWKRDFDEITSNMTTEDKAELFALVDAALAIVVPSDVDDFKKTVKGCLDKAMAGDEIAILGQVSEILFPESQSDQKQTKESKVAAASPGGVIKRPVIDSGALSAQKTKVLSKSADCMADVHGAKKPSVKPTIQKAKSMDEIQLKAMIEKLRLGISIRPQTK